MPFSSQVTSKQLESTCSKVVDLVTVRQCVRVCERADVDALSMPHRTDAYLIGVELTRYLQFDFAYTS
jgi:hypothetical protein